MKENLKNYNPMVLAYMGDAVYEQCIREYLISKGVQDVHALHLAATRYVKAGAQAQVIRTLFDDLTEEEQLLVKRARNKHTASRTRNADPLDYRWATALEALAGYLHLAEEKERLDWLITRAVEIVEQERSQEVAK